EGYYPLDSTETVAPGQRTEVSYFVERVSYNPFDVLVRAPRPRKEVNRTSIEVAEADKVPGTFGDVLAVVQNLPGVARSQFGTGAIVIRGSSPEDSQVYVDGVDVPLIYHFGGLRSVIPVGMLERVDFYPGNFSSYYGRATGGIIDVGIKRLQPERLSGYADVNLFDAGAYLEIPIGDKGAIAIAARRSYIDVILDAVVPDDSAVSLTSAPRFYDYQLLGTYRPSPGHELRAFFFGSDDQVRLLFGNPGDADLRLGSGDVGASTRFYRTLLDYKYVPNDRFENTLKVAAGRNWLDFSAGDAFVFDLNFYVAQVRDTLRWRLLDNLTLMTGVDYLFNKADADFKLPLVAKEGERQARPDLSTVLVSSIRDDVTHSLGSFLEAEIELWGRLLVVPGLRFDYFTRTEEMSVAPRLGMRLKISDWVTAKGGVGMYVQEPSFEETADVFGNPELGLESAIHYSLGAEVTPLEYLTFDATVFYKDLRNLVSRNDGTVERNGEVVPQRYDNGGDGRVYGLELLVRHEFANNFFGWLSYTLSRAERRDSGSKAFRLFDYDQTHIFAAVASYRLPANWEIGARWRYVTGNLDTPVVGGVLDSDADTYEPIIGRSNSRRVAPFHQLDVRVDKRWIFDNWMLTVYLDVQNVYYRTNEEGLDYNFDYTEQAVQGGLPILAIFGVRGEF
ncbi:TonB-dependent receptor plug domain-containing protein, partial [Myxococcota bacterium]